ncbi:MAG: hypothetical protein U5L09_07665 [Bacteroidales bacterium]|nr:hypothetical protein [Bacteroidales bacterium]
MKKLSILFIAFLTVLNSGISQEYLNGGFLPDTIKNDEPLNFSNNTSAELIDKIHPTNDFEGMPLDIEKAGSNIFVFTDKKLLHFDDQFSLINNVDISNKASQYRNVVFTREFSSSNKNLAYSAQTNELFVVNNDGEIGY